jgi:hypothetical protein
MLDGLLKLFCRLFEDKGAAQKQERAERKGTAIPHNGRRSRVEKNNLAKKKTRSCLFATQILFVKKRLVRQL